MARQHVLCCSYELNNFATDHSQERDLRDCTFPVLFCSVRPHTPQQLMKLLATNKSCNLEPSCTALRACLPQALVQVQVQVQVQVHAAGSPRPLARMAVLHGPCLRCRELGRGCREGW